MSAHAYKQVPPKPTPRVSFVEAVTKHGDNWKLGIPFPLASGLYRDTSRDDDREYARMQLMEQGILPRVDLYPATGPAIVTEFVYPPIPERCFDWSAVREGYNGAPDSHCPQGFGCTKFEAIADLLEQEEA